MPRHVPLKILLLCRLSQSKKKTESTAKDAASIAFKKTVIYARTSLGMLLMKKKRIPKKAIIPPAKNKIVESGVLTFSFLIRERNCLSAAQAPKPPPATAPAINNLATSDNEKWYLAVVLSTRRPTMSVKKTAIDPLKLVTLRLIVASPM
jgi:hypothetical protein